MQPVLNVISKSNQGVSSPFSLFCTAGKPSTSWFFHIQWLKCLVYVLEHTQCYLKLNVAMTDFLFMAMEYRFTDMAVTFFCTVK